jgi:hypothetical protein
MARRRASISLSIYQAAAHMASDAHGRDCYTNTFQGRPITEHELAYIANTMAAGVESRKRSKAEKPSEKQVHQR